MGRVVVIWLPVCPEPLTSPLSRMLLEGATFAATKAVVASAVLESLVGCVGAVGRPVYTRQEHGIDGARYRDSSSGFVI